MWERFNMRSFLYENVCILKSVQDLVNPSSRCKSVVGAAKIAWSGKASFNLRVRYNYSIQMILTAIRVSTVNVGWRVDVLGSRCRRAGEVLSFRTSFFGFFLGFLKALNCLNGRNDGFSS